MAEDKEKEPQSGGKSKTMLFLAIGVVVLLIAVGVTAYLLGARSAQNAGAEVEVEETTKVDGIGPMVDVKDFIMNILDKNETRYLKASITLELENEETVVEVNERMPQIRDSILLLIGSKTFSELNDLQGKLQLRAEVIVQLNKLLKKGKIKGIYFTEFVVQ